MGFVAQPLTGHLGSKEKAYPRSRGTIDPDESANVSRAAYLIQSGPFRVAATVSAVHHSCMRGK